jgi:hypothetical protein
MTTVPFPAGKGSGEQWVRNRFAKEVSACRFRVTGKRAETALVVIIDADAYTVEQRLQHLADALHEAGIDPLQNNELIARLIPKRNVETWILCLNDHRVDEITDYKGTRRDLNELVPEASEALFRWTRPNARVPGHCVNSLAQGLRELNRLEQ